ncbi:nose resistant to fluoxetine protein 6-like isoform X2 [Bacillus rossius redtenbacheri]|uniref:nose resistant to fluoxetine protein 6-like isoform X2 n=1 Tax=Bacillus rossius redtenbacheri TaxID=93214 RepID=UPI002FDE06E6
MTLRAVVALLCWGLAAAGKDSRACFVGVNDSECGDCVFGDARGCGWSPASRLADHPRGGGAELGEELDPGPTRALMDLLRSIPVHAPSSPAVSGPCRADSQLLEREARRFRLWALKMADATAKLPSGLLNGNVNQFGDFDQCLEVHRGAGAPLTARYCLAYLDVEPAPWASPAVREVDSLLHSHHAVRSRFHDPGHRIPRFSLVNWGFCVPDSCGAADLESWLQDAFSAVNNSTELRVAARVDPAMCYTREAPSLTFTAAAAMLFFLAIICAAVIGTWCDYAIPARQTESRSLQALKAFSLRRNWRQLTSTQTPADDLRSVHGLRAINALALVLFHKGAAFQFNPFVNRTAMQSTLGMPWSIIGRISIIYTDSFIMFSGLLTSYSFVKELDERGRLSVWEKYWSRYIRITPNLLAIILFCTYVMVHLGSGPQWNLVVKHHSDICQQTMWRNFLYIHNYYGFQNMCLTHTHQLGIDMQLFALSPGFVYLLWRSRWLGLSAAALVGAWSAALRYAVSMRHGLSTVVYFGVPVSKLFDTANMSYVLPSHRITVYLIGIVLGYYLRRAKKVHMTKAQAVLGWALAVVLALTAMCGPYHMARRGYRFEPSDAALYHAWSPVVWSGFLVWAIVSTESGYGGPFGDLISWKGFIVFTRIAYAVYLTQFPVYFYNVGTNRHAQYYHPFMLFEMGEVTTILLASVAMTLLFDLPALQLKRILWRRKPAAVVEVSEDDQLARSTSSRG